MKTYGILVVDDELGILKSMKRMLRGEKYRTYVTTDAREALELLKHESIDIIISDQRMPGMTGTEFLSIVKREHPDIIRILFSGYLEFESLISAINEASIKKFIAKPWDSGELLNLLEELLSSRGTSPEKLAGILNALHENDGQLTHVEIYRGEDSVVTLSWPME